MKIRFKILTPLIALCGALAATSAFGQTTVTWTGGDGTGLDVGAATNWGGTLPSTANGDTAQWDNLVPGNLALTYNGGLASGFGQNGINFAMTANQVGSVNVSSPVGASANLAIWNFVNNSPNGAFSLGGTTANVLNVIWRPGNADELHTFENNSASPCIIYPNVRIQSGGGVTHTLLFQGTGNWRVTNNIIVANSPSTRIQKTGSGTLFWNGPSITAALGNGTIISPITIAGGTVVLQNNTVLSPSGVGTTGTQSIENGGDRFKYDAPSLSQTLSGVISGAGILEVANGSLILSGASTYSGNTLLSGGALVVNGAENPGIVGPLGVGNTISFAGGALQFSANNVFDYSSRFNTAASQAYKIDTGGQNVTLATALASSGATFAKLGSGTLTLAGASSYSGLTTVSAGRLVFQGSKTGSGNITVADGATLGVTGTGTQVTPATLTVGTSSGATLGFNNVTSTSTAILAAGTLSSVGTITVNVNSGSFAVGQSYPLFTWTGGSAPTVALGTLNGAVGNLSIVGNKVQLNVTALAYVWSGANNANWDTTTANNWLLSGSPSAFANGGAALFDDTASGPTDVILNAAVLPASVAVNSSSKTYSITSSGANVIGGSSTFSKAGSSTLTLSGGVNNYSGATTLGGGILSIAALGNGGAASDIGAAGSSAANVVFDSGTLRYTGGAASSDRLFTVGTSGGTFDASGSGALSLNNSGSIGLSGSGVRVLTLTGTDVDDNTLAATLGDNGGATALTKSGAGKWVLTGNNTNSGVTTIAGGILQIGNGGASGFLGSGNVTDNGSLIFNTSGTRTNSTIGGTGSVTLNGSGTIILPGDNSFGGGTTINAGTLQVGNGGATGKLNGGGALVNNGAFIVNSTGTFTLNGGVISGAGNVIVRGSGGLFQALGANTYTGWTLVEPGATFQPSQGNQGALASSIVTNNGTLLLTRQDNGIFIYSGPIVGTGALVVDANNINTGDVTLTGSNTYTGGTFIRNNTLILGDGNAVGGGTILGNVLFTNSPTPNENPRRIVFNHPEDLTITNLITYSTNLLFGNRGIVEQRGAGTLTLLANNDYPGGTVVSNGVIQVGNGGTTGAIGTGPVSIQTRIDFNRADALSYGVNATFSGSGSVVQKGPGTLTLNGTNNILGSLTVSNGSLFMNNENFAVQNDVIAGTLGGTGAFYGPITLAAGTTFAPGASAGAVGTLTSYGALTIGGNVAVELNKSLVQSNDLVMALGGVTKTGAGTLTVANVGTPIVIGDKFTLFSQPVSGGAALTVTGAGVTWQNNLATDGSITALTSGPSVNPNPPVLQVSVSGGNLNLAWPTNLGWTLQTNSVSLTAAGQWFAYPGSATITNVSIPITIGKTNVFFRMVYP